MDLTKGPAVNVRMDGRADVGGGRLGRWRAETARLIRFLYPSEPPGGARIPPGGSKPLAASSRQHPRQGLSIYKDFPWRLLLYGVTSASLGQPPCTSNPAPW